MATTTASITLSSTDLLSDDLAFTTENNLTTAGSSTGLTNTTGLAKMESIRQLKYRPGLGSLVRFTTLYETGGVANSTQIAGVGDDNDGFFFGYNGNSFGILVRKGGVDTWTAQSAWSMDTMIGGAGPSQMSLDTSKLNIYSIEYQWLGAGQITFKIEDSTSGKIVPVHVIKYANQYTEPSTNNSTFGLYMLIEKTAGTTNIVMKSASMAGFVEGKFIVNGPINSFSNDITTSNGTILNIYNKTSYGGTTNRVTAFLTTFSVANDISRLATFTIYLNATLSGTETLVDVNGDNSIMQSDIVRTYDSGGKVLFSSTVAKDSGQTFMFPENKFFIKPGDILTIVINSTTSGDVGCSISWQEDF